MRWALGAATAAMTACTLLTPLDEYEGGGSADAAARPGDETEVRTPDARDDDVARSDAPADAGPFTCATHATDATVVCTQFENDLREGWDDVDKRQDGGSLALSFTEYVSAPKGMEARLDLDDSANVSAAIRVFHDFEKLNPRHVHIAFSIKIDRRPLAGPPATQFISIAELLCGTGGTTPPSVPFNGVWLQFRAGDPPVLTVYHGNDSQKPIPGPNGFPFGQWARVSLDVRFENNTTTSEIQLNGVPIGGNQTAGIVCKDRGDLRAVVGLSSDVTTRAFYDDVIVDYE